MFFRTKTSGTRSYLQIVENRWVDGRPRQRVIATLGRLDQRQQSGQLDAGPDPKKGRRNIHRRLACPAASRRRDMSTTAAAASLIPEAFPAVTVPPVLKAVGSLPIFSREVSMGLSSVSKII